MWRAALVVCACAVVAVPAYADPPSPENAAGPGNDVQGVVPVKSQAGSKTAGAGGNLVYHAGGSVMATNRTYAIYWVPPGYTVSANYRTTLDGFLANVAADSGKQTNVYYSDTQYYGPAGAKIAYSSSFGGSVLDANAFPPSGCSDTVAATSVCLFDAQLQAEINRVASANGWPRGLGSLFFIYTPLNVGSCYATGSCAFANYCAYHSHFGSGSSVTLYANQPYTETSPSGCGTGRAPSGDQAADSTINVVSHEHNEAITDALGNAWYDRRGYENGDKCAWNFGSTGANYNQSIGSGRYYLQQEWSNQSSGCVLSGL
jgi:hypothetical protein